MNYNISNKTKTRQWIYEDSPVKLSARGSGPLYWQLCDDSALFSTLGHGLLNHFQCSVVL